MKVQNTQHFENFSLIQNNPSGASRHLPLHKGGFDFCETTKNRFIDTLSPPILGGLFLSLRRDISSKRLT